MMLEKAVPKRSHLCCQCGQALGHIDQGTSVLYVKSGSKLFERQDFCAQCLISQPKDGKRKKSKTASWHWEKIQSEKKEAYDIQNKLLFMLEKIFSQSEYQAMHQYEYTVLIILSRIGLIQKRHGIQGSCLFLWKKDEGKKIVFRTLPESLSQEAYSEIYGLIAIEREL